MGNRTRTLIGVAMLLGFIEGHAQELLTTADGVSLYGTARLVGRDAATCNVLEERETAESYERMRINHGQPLDIWELEYSVFNGTGRALDHLTAYYQVESPHPPCTDWDEHWEAGDYSLPVDWSGHGGRIQRTGDATPTRPNQTVAETMLVLAFRGVRPHFSDWSVNYTFLDGGAASSAASQQPRRAPGSDAAIAVASTEAEPPEAIAPNPVCPDRPEGSACWMELANLPGCHVWNPNPQQTESASWTGGCVDGYVNGQGTVTWVYGADGENVSASGPGPYLNGKMHGDWIVTDADGNVGEGSFVDGERHGNWVVSLVSGGVQEGPFVNGELQGHWVFTDSDGDVREGPFMAGKRHGRWVITLSNGMVEEGLYVDGERQGRWVERGNDYTRETPYVNGQRHGTQVERWENLFGDYDVVYQETPYVDGQIHGTSVKQYAPGYSTETPFVNGQIHGTEVLRNGDGSVAFIWVYVNGEIVDSEGTD